MPQKKTKSSQPQSLAPIPTYNKFFEEVSSLFYERDWEFNQLRYAILIGEHVLLKGVPGTAKSMISKKIFEGFQGARVYEAQFTRMMDESYLFGVQLLDEFKKGNIRHNTKDSIVDAHFARLDEFFNASEETLVSTLEILNERTFTRGAQVEQSPLIAAVMTTNQEREGEKELRAVYDRILFKSEVSDLAESKNRISMYCDYLEGKTDSFQPIIDFVVFQKLRDDFNNFAPTISESVLFVYDSVVSEYEVQNSIQISPRKKNKMLKIMKASAFLQGNDTITIADIEEIKYALVCGGDEKALTFFDTIFKKVKDSLKNAEVIQKLEKLFDANQAEKDTTVKYKTLVGMHKKCEGMLDKMKNDAQGAVLVQMLESLHKKVLKAKDELEANGLNDSDVFKA